MQLCVIKRRQVLHPSQEAQNLQALGCNEESKSSLLQQQDRGPQLAGRQKEVHTGRGRMASQQTTPEGAGREKGARRVDRVRRAILGTLGAQPQGQR